MTPLLKYPLAYCIAGGIASLFHSVRAEWWGLFFLSGLIALYAYLAKGERDVGRHEVGDNCYFIGFVYTLAVITVSLIFDAGNLSEGGESDLRSLLKTIGIALGTSLVGMLCRFALKHDIAIPEDEFDRAVSKAAVAANNLESAVARANECVARVEQSLSQAAGAMKKYSEQTEEEAKKVGRSMSGVAERLLEDFGKRIADSLQTTHFDGVREALQSAVEEHRAAVSRVNETLSQSLAELNAATKTTVANVEGVQQALSSLESAVGGSDWTAMNSAVRTFSEGVNNLNAGLRTLAEKQAAAAGEAERDIQRLREMRSAFDGLLREIHGDTEAIAKIKEDYRRAFDQAAQAALEETHRLYGRLIAGAELALGGIENLGEMSKDLRTIARSIERGGDRQ